MHHLFMNCLPNHMITRIEEAYPDTKVTPCLKLDPDETEDYFQEEENQNFDPICLVGKEILNNDFFVIQHIGSGGASEVYKVLDKNKNIFAAKIIKANKKVKTKKRSEKEIKLLLSIPPHPNIIKVVTHGYFKGNKVLILEYANNGSLSSLLVDRFLSYKKSLSFLVDVCDGLLHIHGNNFIHRDIKPQNILICNEIAKLSDFGMAKDLKNISDISSLNSINGTINYIAPELLNPESKKYDFFTDIYSLGITIFHVLSGRLPFSGNIYQVIKHHVETVPPRPSELNRKISKDLEEIMLKMLNKNPYERPSIKEIRDLLLEELI